MTFTVLHLASGTRVTRDVQDQVELNLYSPSSQREKILELINQWNEQAAGIWQYWLNN